MKRKVGVIGLAVGLLVSILSFCLDVKGEEASVLAPEIEMEGYKVKFNKRGEMNLYYQDKLVIDYLGGIQFVSYGGEKHETVFSPPDGTYITIKDLPQGKECTWGASMPVLGISYRCKASLLPYKMKWVLTYSFKNGFKGAIGFYPRLFPKNPKIMLGSAYEITDSRGKMSKEKFPSELPSKLENYSGELGNHGIFKLYSPLGLIIFRTNRSEKKINDRGIFVQSHPTSFLLACHLDVKDRVYPKEFSEDLEIEIEFEAPTVF